MKILTLILITFLTWTIPISAKQTPLNITWVLSDTPPFHISSGSLAGQGICDGLVRELESNITGATFDTLLIPQSRIGKMLASGKSVCFPCMIHNAQDADRIVYSNPALVFPPFVVITTKENASKITGSNESIDIVELMNDSSWVFGKEAARRYGALHSVISSLPAFRNAIFSHNSKDSTTAIAELLSRGRIDYTIDYPTTFELFKRRGYNNLTYIPITQADKFVVGAVGCSAQNNQFSGEALKRINEALSNKVLRSNSFKKHLDFWMNDYPDYHLWYEKEVLNKN